MTYTKVLWLAMALIFSYPVTAGVFGGAVNCSDSADCEPLGFVSDPQNVIPPFAITHPPGYDGSGGKLQYRICLGAGSESLKGPLQRAIDTWNSLIPTTGNCTGCKVWEEAAQAPMIVHAETTLLHELGHCPMGLGHPDRNWDAANDGEWEFTSFTSSWDVAAPPNGILIGPDFIRGTLDDIQQKGGGMIPESVHWFRIADNNPFTVDGTVIDKSTYSRSIVQDLPAGHSWAVNANRRVGEELGVPNTQAVMYSLQSEGENKTSLTADDVAMVQMGMTGRARTRWRGRPMITPSSSSWSILARIPSTFSFSLERRSTPTSLAFAKLVTISPSRRIRFWLPTSLCRPRIPAPLSSSS